MSRRKRWMLRPLSWRRGGAIGLALVFLLAIAALVLDSGGASDIEPVVSRLEERGRPPVELIAEAGRAAEVVLLSDIQGLPAPKRVAAEAVRALAEGPGLDAVVLAVPSDEQPYIDTYLSAPEEDATLILNRPRAVREEFGASREYLEIYRAVYEANANVSAARRIRIIAADHPDWPPPGGASSSESARLYAGRTEHMLRRMDEELLSRIPDARLLVFVDGYMTLKRTHGQVRFAGGDPVRVDWLGEAMRQRAGGTGVRTVLLDAGGGIPTGRVLPNYHGTTFYRELRREVNGSVGVRTSEHFAGFEDPILEISSPSLRLEIFPDNVTLRDVADVYAILGSGR